MKSLVSQVESNTTNNVTVINKHPEVFNIFLNHISLIFITLIIWILDFDDFIIKFTFYFVEIILYQLKVDL